MESLEKIRELLERFYQGESTLEEEGILGEFFSTSSVPEDLLADRELFERLQHTKEDIEVPAGLQQKIIQRVDREARREVRSRRISLYSMSGLAAGILAIIAVYVFFLKDDAPVPMAVQQYEDTYEDPMLAYEEARQTLAYVSHKLNQGTSELKHVQEVTRAGREPLQSLSKMKSGKQELLLLGKLQKVREIDN